MKKLAVFCILLAAFFWGCLSLITKLLVAQGFSSMQIVLLRMLSTGVLLLIYLLLWRRDLLRIRLRDAWLFMGNGIISMGLSSYFYFVTIELASISVAVVLLNTSPIFVMILSLLLFGEKLTPAKLIALAMTSLGCVLVTGLLSSGVGRVATPAILTGLASGFTYCLYNIFTRLAMNRGYHNLTICIYTFAFGLLGCLVAVSPASLINHAWNGPAWLAVLALGTVGTLLPFLLYFYGLRYVETSKASILATFEPVSATLIGVLLFHETIGLMKGAGMLLILAAVVLLSLKFGQKQEQPPQMSEAALKE